MSIALNQRVAELRWSKGSCGEGGCVCALCARPIGVSENDPRWETHGEDCYECEICVDQVPIILFRQRPSGTEQAALHKKCFEALKA